MKNKLSPSIMCADFFELKDTLHLFKKAEIEYLHIDIMDGCFVPNYTLGTDFVKFLKGNTDIPLDIHFMIENPENKIGWFDFGENDYVSVHVETTKHLQKLLLQIRERGAKPMVAINPATPICTVENVLENIDAVLVMTVNPGFAGQKLVPSTLKKITDLRNFLDNSGFGNIEIEVDGNVSFENAKIMKEAGANIFVGGTSSIFNKEHSITDNIELLRKMIL
ncbi:MAG: ribulose-phosphate 3-epimerase [Clostridia bacterium]|nr:ribulose-phosphate 3-epimerase [Clostridia bacterium]